MPIAAKLSRKLYETLGEEAAEAMVDWMEQADRNRADLREMNDLAFGRMDARFGESDARFRESEERMRREVRADLAEFRQAIEAELAKVRQELNDIRSEFPRIESGLSRLELLIERTNGRIDSRFSELLKWSFTFWAGSTLTLLGIALVLARWRP